MMIDSSFSLAEGKPKKLFGVPYFVYVMHDKMGEDPETPGH